MKTATCRAVFLILTAACALLAASCDLPVGQSATDQSAGQIQAAPAPQATTAPQAPPLVQPASVVTGIDVVQVYTQILPSVVNITTSQVPASALRQPVDDPAGTGTGVIFDPRGYLLTNSHVIRGPDGAVAPTIRVTLSDERVLDARVIDDDPANDLAVLAIQATGLQAARIGDSDALRVGEPVVAVGFALALPGGPTVSSGVVSAIGRTIEEPNGVVLPNMVQTDAAINPGNSGGPLLNARAEVIGINTAGTQRAQGISFAVAINQARPTLESIVATGRVVRPFLGVQILGSVTPAIARANNLPVNRGVAVQVVPGSPAASAGIRDGDIIVAMGDVEVRSTVDLQREIRSRQPGDAVRVRVVRPSGEQATVTVTLAEAPR